MVYAPFRRYNPEGKTWASKEEHDNEFNEFRISDEMKNRSYQEVLREWRLKPEHMGRIGYRIYSRRSQIVEQKLFKRMRRRLKIFPKKPK
ncbi:MAG: hypothetical protein ABIA76_02480 [Candidatus Diapherotrites archaeon]